MTKWDGTRDPINWHRYSSPDPTPARRRFHPGVSQALSPILYHGTSTGYLKQILGDGLDPRSSYKGYLCYSDELRCSTWFARCMAEWDSNVLDKDCDPVILRIDTTRFDPSLFCLEENFIEFGPVHCRGADHVDLIQSRDDWTWRALYELTGGVGYKGPLKVAQADIVDLRS
jgi:hypothetical protein